MKYHPRPYLFPLCLLLLNAFGLWIALRAWQATLTPRGGDPVLIATPDAQESLAAGESVHWEWDLPVVSPDHVGEFQGKTPVEISPELAGSFRWDSEKKLVFTPGDPWPAARSIDLNLQLLTTNAAHRVFSFSHRSRLAGPPLKVLKMEPFLEARRRELQVRLKFNAPVDADRLVSCTALQTEKGEKVALRFRETPQPDELLLLADWSGDEHGTLTVGGKDADAGGLQISEKTFEIRALHRFNLTGLEVRQSTFEPAIIFLSFSDAPSLQSVMDGLKIEPPVEFSVGEGKYWQRNTCSVSGDFEQGKTYKLRFPKGILSVSDKPLHREEIREVRIPMKRPGLKFVHTGTLLNAAGAGQIELQVENEGKLTVILEKVHDSNLVEVAVRASGNDNWRSRDQATKNMAAQVWHETLKVVGDGVVPLDLSGVLEEQGQGVYKLRIRGAESGHEIEKIITVSDLGLLALENLEEIRVAALRLDSALPPPVSKICLWSDQRQLLAESETDAEGLCTLVKKTWEENGKGSPFLLTIQSGSSFGMMPLENAKSFPGQNGSRSYVTQGNEAYIYTDRDMYRPQETVHARCIVRGPSFSLPGEFPVQWELRDATGKIYWKTQTVLSDVGTAEVSVPLQDEWPNLSYWLQISLPGESSRILGQATFHLQSFVPPQVVVELDTPEGEESVPDAFMVYVNARLLYGAPAAGHEGMVTLTLMPDEFRSSEYPDYIFSDSRKDRFSSRTRPLSTFTTDADGRTDFKIRVKEDHIGPSALRAVVGVSVKEFSGRTASAVVSRRVDLFPAYVGLKTEVKDEEHVQVDVIGLKPKGGLTAENRKLEISWYRLSWQRGYRKDSKGRCRYFSEEVAVREGGQGGRLDAGRHSLELKLTPNASYRIAVRDPVSGFSTSRVVHLGEPVAEPARADVVSLSLDKRAYTPGETARLTLQSPFAGRALISMEDREFHDLKAVRLAERNAEWTFTVPETEVGNLWVRVRVLRPQPGRGAQPVIQAAGAIPLRINTGNLHQPLTLRVDEQLRPSSGVELRLTGEPGAEVVIAGVDEGILLLSDFATPDPLSWFRALRRVTSVSYDSLNDLLPELGPGLLAGKVKMGGGLGAALKGRKNPVDAKRFKPLAWWSGARRIPESGILTLRMSMPEFSGKVRWMAVQVGVGGMGHAEAFSQVGRDVVVQQSLPLFLAPGDRSTWRVRVHNRSESEQRITLTPSLSGPVQRVDPAGSGDVSVILPPGEIVHQEFQVLAAPEIGKAELRLGIDADGEKWSDGIELAVRPVQAFETRAERQLLAPGKGLELSEAEGMLAGTGQRTLQVSSSPALQLAAARNVLMNYPYGCIEQTVSTAAPALYLDAGRPEVELAARQQLQAGVHELWKKQRNDGSFGYWSGQDRVSVSGSFYALWFLLETREKGVEVHEASLNAALRWAERWLNAGQWEPGVASENLQRVQACRVLAKAGKLDAGWLQQLRERRENLSGYARVLAAETFMVCGRRPLALEMLEGLSRVNDGWSWHSRNSGNAELLWLLLQLDPSDGRILPLLKDLLEQRNARGAWAHTYENASVIRAMVAFENTWPADDGNFNVTLRGEAGPVRHLEDGVPEKNPVGTLRNEGSRPVYVERVTEGIPLKPLPVRNTFEVERSLYRLDGHKLESGTPLPSGETMMLRLEMKGLPRQVANLVLDQRLPAGLEPLPSSQQSKPGRHMHKNVDERVETPRHLEVRDDRFLLFPWKTGPGKHVYYVLVRTVSPGTYTFPALFAQDMYDEHLIFRGAEEKLEVRP